MHVLYFHQHFSTPSGASGTRSYEMAQELVAQGHRVTMVCGSLSNGVTGLDTPFVRGRREGAVDGIHVIEFALQYGNSDGFLSRSMAFVKYALGSIGLVLTRQYDLVFATSTPLTAGIPGVSARLLRRKPFVFEVRDLWPELPREMGAIRNPFVLAALSALEWCSYHAAHRCIALAPGIAEGIARRRIAQERIAMIPNGCDMAIFSGGEAPRWRPDGVSSSDLMAVFSGTHGQANGLDAVLDAAGVLKRKQRNDIKFVLIGDGKLKPDLVARARAEGLDNVIFCPPVSKVKLAGLLAETDIGLQCLANIPAFYYGTSPNKFFDYLASGLPVLCNYPGWIAEHIAEADCGFAVPPDDPEPLAAALVQAADDREGLRRMGVNAQALANRQFGRKKLAQEWVAWVARGERV